MKTVILKHVNLVDEAMYILHHMANTSDMNKKMESFVGYFPKTEEAYRKKAKVLLNIYEDVKRKLTCPKEKLEYYFTERADFMANYASLALVYKRTCYDYTIEKLKEEIKNYSDHDRLRVYADLIWDEEAESIGDDQLKTLEDLVSFLERSSLKEAECWETIKIFKHQEKHFNEVIEIVEEVVHLLEAHMTEIKELEKAFAKTWKNYKENNGIVRFIQEGLDIKWELSEDGCVIIPDLFLFLGVMLSLKSRLKKEDVIRLGILFDDQVRLVQKMIDSERIVKFGKVISDKSKVEILRFINHKSAYGKEIADALKLSTPTISYHVNALMQLGLVKTSIEANKVYYTINKEAIEKLLDEIKTFFLTE